MQISSQMESNLSRKREVIRGVQVTDLRAIVGEHRVDPVRHRLDEGLEEGGGGVNRCAFLRPGEGEFRGSIDGDEELGLALGGLVLGDGDVDVADRGRA